MESPPTSQPPAPMAHAGATLAAAASAASSSSAHAPSGGAAGAAAPGPAPAVQSRFGRSVHKPAEVYKVEAPPHPTNTNKPNKRTTHKGKATAGKGKAKAKRAHPAADEASHEYRGEGWSVCDHAWFPLEERRIEYASPTIPHLESVYMQITCEEACRQQGLEMTREMKVDLDHTTLDKLRASLSSEHEKGEQNKTVLALCEHGVVRGCALYQSDKHDIDSIKVVTTRFIHDKELITIYMGRLIETDQFEAEYGGRARFHVSSYDIKRESLPADYTGPDLMLDTNRFANEAKFIRDARWDDHDISANVQCRIVWNHARGIPFVAIVAIGDIDAGAELFVDWGDAAWSTHARGKLHRMAHVSHEQHFRLRQLQHELARRGVEPYASDAANRPQITDDVAFEDFHYADGEDEPTGSTALVAAGLQLKKATKGKKSSTIEIRGDEVVHTEAFHRAGEDPPAAAAAAAGVASAAASSGSSLVASSSPSAAKSRRLEGVMSRVPPPSNVGGTSPTFVLRNTPHVFDNCGVELMARCDYSSLTSEATAAWVKAAGRNCSAANLKPTLKAVLETGRCPKAAVYEVVSLRHPARFYSPPDCAIYALLAREVIEKNEPIGVYVGKVHEAAPFHGDYTPEDRIKQVYAYDMNASLFDGILLQQGAIATAAAAAAAAAAASFKDALPDLVCESLSIGGNETRFVNDSWCRRGGAKSKNAEATPEFDPIHGNMPVMVIRASRRIQKGEEIVTDYGETFWCKISTALCAEHQAFQQKATAQIVDCARELKRLMDQAGDSAAGTPATPSRPTPTGEPPAATAGSASSSPAAPAVAVDAGGGVSSILPAVVDPLVYLESALPPSDRWSCYRGLFNQWDVRYAHRKPPVRLDPAKHVDPLPIAQAQATRLLKRELREKEEQKVERAKARADQAVAKAAAAARVAALASAPDRHNGRVSARVSSAAQLQQEAAAKKAAAEAEEKATREQRRAVKLAERLQAKSRLLGLADGGGGSAHAPGASLPPMAADDSDVEILSHAPPSASARKSTPHRSLVVTHSKEVFPCECGEAEATFREYKDTTFKACRACFKKRCAALLAGVEWHPTGSSGAAHSAGAPGGALAPVHHAGVDSPSTPLGVAPLAGASVRRPLHPVTAPLSPAAAHRPIVSVVPDKSLLLAVDSRSPPTSQKRARETEAREEKAFAKAQASGATAAAGEGAPKRAKLASADEQKHMATEEDDEMID